MFITKVCSNKETRVHCFEICYFLICPIVPIPPTKKKKTNNKIKKGEFEGAKPPQESQGVWGAKPPKSQGVWGAQPPSGGVWGGGAFPVFGGVWGGEAPPGLSGDAPRRISLND